MGERDPYFWLGLGTFSGLFLGPLLLLVDDGVPLGMALGGLAGVADFALSGVIAICPFTIYLLMFLGGS